MNSSNRMWCWSFKSHFQSVLSVKPVKKIFLKYFITLQLVILIKPGSFWGGSLPYLRGHLALLETPGRLQFWKLVALEIKGFHT